LKSERKTNQIYNANVAN